MATYGNVMNGLEIKIGDQAVLIRTNIEIRIKDIINHNRIKFTVTENYNDKCLKGYSGIALPAHIKKSK